MKTTFWQRINYFVGILPIAALFGMVTHTTQLEIKDLDLWLHIGVGNVIVEQGSVPTEDILSVTMAGKSWNNHEWLFQVIVSQLFQHFGPEGIINMQTVLVGLTLLLLLLLGYHRDRQMTVTFLLLLVYLVYQQRFTTRPDLFSLFFLTSFVYLLSTRMEHKMTLLWLSLIQVLWTNIHGFFFFGPLFMGIGLASEWIKRRVPLPYEWNEAGRLTDGEYRNLKIGFLLVAAACLLNPQGLKGALYPFEILLSIGGESQIFFKYIQELKRPVTSETLFRHGPFAYYKLLIVLSSISFVFNRRRLDISALFFWLVFLFFSIKAARNTAFFAIAAYLVIITNMTHISYKELIPIRFISRKFEYLTLAFIKMLILVWILNYFRFVGEMGYYDFKTYNIKSQFGGISLKNYPDGPVDFLVENEISGNFFNDFNSGAYLIGRTHPRVKVFIDGRTELYGPKFFKKYQSIWEGGDTEALAAMIEKYDLTGAFLNSVVSPVHENLLTYFHDQADWAPVYFDEDGMIFLKRIPRHADVIARYEIDFDQYRPRELDWVEYSLTYTKPVPFLKRANTLLDLGYPDLAAAEVMIALKAAPDDAEAHELMGRIFLNKEAYQTAYESFRRAAMYNPGGKSIRYNLAGSLLAVGEYERALKQFELVLNRWPQLTKPSFKIAEVYARLGEVENTFLAMADALARVPDAFEPVVKIGDAFFEEGDWDSALSVYSQALKSDDQSAEVWMKVARAYWNSGEPELAEEAAGKALATAEDPEFFRDSWEVFKSRDGTVESSGSETISKKTPVENGE